MSALDSRHTRRGRGCSSTTSLSTPLDSTWLWIPARDATWSCLKVAAEDSVSCHCSLLLTAQERPWGRACCAVGWGSRCWTWLRWNSGSKRWTVSTGMGWLVAQLRAALAGVADLERIIGRVVAGSVAPRELLALKSGLETLPELGERVCWPWLRFALAPCWTATSP